MNAQGTGGRLHHLIGGRSMIARHALQLRRLGIQGLVIGGIGILGACTDSRSAAPTSPSAARRTVSAATTITVANTNDAGAGSLRQAIADATDGSTVQFDPSIAGGTISLSTGQLVIDKSLSIQGPISGGITINGAGNGRVLNISATTGGVTLSNLTVTGGLVGDPGGGIATAGGLTLDHVLVTGNQATTGVGGGIYLQQSGQAAVSIVNSTITGNSAATGGGGIYIEIGHVTLTNATVAGNTGTGVGETGDGLVTIGNSIVAGNSAGNCATPNPIGIELSGTNLSDDSSCGVAGASMLVGDPRLGSLASNGGPTRTLALQRDSPAVDAAGTCSVTTDERYVTRPQGAACDIGAYEFNDFVKLLLSIDGNVAVNPTTGAATLTGTIGCPESVSLTLHVALAQLQKTGRLLTTVSATDDVTLTCNGTKTWAIPLAASSGGFQAGPGFANATTTNLPQYVVPKSASGFVKLYWGHKP